MTPPKWLLAAIAAGLCLCGRPGPVTAQDPRPELAPLAVPMRHGVVFFCPESADEAVKQLEAIKRDGFNLIKFASWAWTLPKPGSPLRERARAVLDWCDREGMAFFLLHNIQYGSQGEGGGLDRQVLDPRQTLPLLADWVDVLRGHECVMGVILGNEVGPSLGSPEEAPRLWGEFRAWLKARHGSLETLNQAWGTGYATLDEVGLPPEGSPGWHDCREYARRRFAGFYGYLVREGLRPVLGDKLYGAKTSPDPFLHRDCRGLTMTCWDDVMAEYPLWRIKCAADTTAKPLFNAELHLYHDTYQYFPSPERSRYRYFTGALLGEYLTASFAWGQWSKPEIQAIHAATPAILADLRRIEAACRALAGAYRRADVAVLVTEESYYRPGIEGEKAHPFALLCAHCSGLGRPWWYLLETDLGEMDRGVLVVWSKQAGLETARALAELPAGVRVLAVDGAPVEDEYGRPLPAELAGRLRERCEPVALEHLRDRIGRAAGLPGEYSGLGWLSYAAWSEKRGHFRYDLPCCPLEALTDGEEHKVIAVVNHTTEAVEAPLPWAQGRTVTDLVTGRSVNADEAARVRFGPLAVKLYRYEP